MVIFKVVLSQAVGSRQFAVWRGSDFENWVLR